MTRYKNVSLSKEAYAILYKISKRLLPDGTKLSISKTVESLANEKIQKLNGQKLKK
tara:strand:+ start:313 stop:480 length:168 start_codon:yes stop_codon:yes gene_type:complete